MAKKKITGLGGVFIKANDAKKPAAGYQETLGTGFNDNTWTALAFSDDVCNITPWYRNCPFLKPAPTNLNPVENR
jgi:hypothetical protein